MRLPWRVGGEGRVVQPAIRTLGAVLCGVEYPLQSCAQRRAKDACTTPTTSIASYARSNRCIAQVLAELTAGAKRSHWMWFIFPQLAGLGTSPTAGRFALGSLAEARAYLAHPLLGPRLLQCTELVNAVQGRAAQEIFGTPDDLKFRSCMTLFAHAAASRSVARRAREVLRGRGGSPHPRTPYLGFLNFRMNWSVWPRMAASNTLAVRGSSLLRSTSLLPSNLKPAASTSLLHRRFVDAVQGGGITKT